MRGRYKLSIPGDERWESFDLQGEQLPVVPRFNIVRRSRPPSFASRTRSS